MHTKDKSKFDILNDLYSDLDFYNPTRTDLWKELSKPSPKKVKPKLLKKKIVNNNRNNGCQEKKIKCRNS